MALRTSPSLNFENVMLARKNLETAGFTVTSDHALGLPGETRSQLAREFFNSRVLQNYPGDIPVDRERARDVVRYDWHGDELRLTEHDTVAIDARGDWSDQRREFDRVEVLADNFFHNWIHAALSVLPESFRQPRGTFGVNLFRTHTNVVTRPHQDGEEFVFVYIVAKTGTGAETCLYGLDSDDDVVHQDTLQPGDLLVFRDRQFRHGVTPLVPLADGSAQRDAVVCTVNYADTYPLSDS